MEDELTAFMRAYLHANNSHVFANVEPFIAADAIYWFANKPYRGMAEIRAVIEDIFDRARDKTYEISNLRWIIDSDDLAVCTYRFSWHSEVGDQSTFTSGRGKDVLEKQGDSWKILYEHLGE